jgi:hypothetical protein
MLCWDFSTFPLESHFKLNNFKNKNLCYGARSTRTCIVFLEGAGAGTASKCKKIGTCTVEAMYRNRVIAAAGAA